MANSVRIYSLYARVQCNDAMSFQRPSVWVGGGSGDGGGRVEAVVVMPQVATTVINRTF